jgi:tripartite-type tricarboxylate transporter receptor subunit TctC
MIMANITKRNNSLKHVWVRATANCWCSVIAVVLVLALILVCFSEVASAAEYPDQNITIMINMAPGGSIDALARLLADKASKILGQEVVPVNKTGGGGSVAAGLLANAKPDGYTIMMGVGSPLVSVPHMESVPYDPLNDVIPILQVGKLYNLIVVRADSPFSSLKDLVEFARKNPGKVSCSVPGIGTSAQIAVEYIKLKEKVDIPTIPFPGSTQAAVALLGGHVMSSSNSPGTSFPHVRAGKLKLLASTDGKRPKEYPNVPTLHESGYPNMIITELQIIAVPKGTPPQIVEKLESTFRTIITGPEYRSLAEKFFVYEENPLSGKALRDLIAKDYAQNGEIIKVIKAQKP